MAPKTKRRAIAGKALDFMREPTFGERGAYTGGAVRRPLDGPAARLHHDACAKSIGSRPELPAADMRPAVTWRVRAKPFGSRPELPEHEGEQIRVLVGNLGDRLARAVPGLLLGPKQGR
jgi:hypothetical protein